MRSHRHAHVPGYKYDAAAYAALSGSMEAIDALLPACVGWGDTLWAHLKLRLSSHLIAQQEHINGGASS